MCSVKESLSVQSIVFNNVVIPLLSVSLVVSQENLDLEIMCQVTPRCV